MANRNRTGKVACMYKLDSKSYADSTAKMRRLADKVLGHYGYPRMSLAQLRADLDEQLQGISLSGLVTKERETGW